MAAISIAAALGVAAALVALGVVRLPWAPGGEREPPSQGRPTVPATDAEDGGQDDAPVPGDDGAEAGEADEKPATASPKDDVRVSSPRLSTDDGGRYVITGSVTNGGSSELTVVLALSATEHDTDRYGEPTETTTTWMSLGSATPNVGCDANMVYVWQVQPGETRAFEVYPGAWTSSEKTYSDVEAQIEEVTLPASVLGRYGRLLDVEGEIEVSGLDYSASGKVTGTLTNNTGTYLEWAEICFVMLDGRGRVAVGDARGTRPAGIAMSTARVTLVKPGDTVEFESDVGEGYAGARVMDVAYRPDESKNGLGATS